ncbi:MULTISPECIES: NAD(P)H-dependent oxidoreductase [Enterobacterales]|uniref:NAD(P)H-dependent oxidoreductase n=1 Tax=Enterobacterales TaxID=91347 RepID=UPI000847E01E|nr:MULTISPECIES: NAD(P)H-dependent oxidoreductase [Enterobacterales]WOO48786.1 NAD(P)H-dependent oxidoreductase [Hafnia alvei]MCK9782882.1 NAD(P)H-dependent oxidoreductase [Proteus columbae]MCT6518869.1 NAD(P)H-dependent oxidoreductase [Proteus vulgaris]ODQ07041.1 NADPH quinone reductase MdaB [Shigella sp. FC130]OEI94436.1 NADPH quinone reductase MdaB [Shigella sp. FC1655]
MNILLINGGQNFGHSAGRLNRTLHDIASEHLVTLGHSVKETQIEEGYDIEEEIEKFLWADTIVYQMPGWWMMMPWKVKKYMDDVYTLGHGKLYENDGRTRRDPKKQYGTGGLLQGKQYMISVTWNAPVEAFNEFGNFFDGRGVDGVYFAFHKSQQFLGLSQLPTFMTNDVIKEPNVDQDIIEYKAHLTHVFG